LSAGGGGRRQYKRETKAEIEQGELQQKMKAKEAAEK
jgi:hypothetical protein